MNRIGEEITTIALAVISLAIIAILVSKKANTTGVIQAAASGLGNNIAVAGAPVTGVSVSPSLGYPTDNSFGYSFGG